jgi:hypothetical protein
MRIDLHGQTRSSSRREEGHLNFQLMDLTEACHVVCRASIHRTRLGMKRGACDVWILPRGGKKTGRTCPKFRGHEWAAPAIFAVLMSFDSLSAEFPRQRRKCDPIPDWLPPSPHVRAQAL